MGIHIIICKMKRSESSMKWKVRLIMKAIQRGFRKAFVRQFGPNSYRKFCTLSKQNLARILPCVPDIGKSVFSIDYYFSICCLNWFDTFRIMGQSSAQAASNLTFICEEYIKTWPAWLLQFTGKYIYNGIRLLRAEKAEKMAADGKLHDFDWRIKFRRLDKNTFQYNIYECSALKLAQKLDLTDAFPTVCRMDYLLSHYIGNEFRRTGTLADGNDCCDSWLRFPGYTPWPVPIDIEGKRYQE